jgi:hypothetical protein
MVDLNSLIPADSDLHLFNACGIYSRREIIGLAFDAQGNFYGFFATPSNSAADSSAEVSAAIRSWSFEYAWRLLRQRIARPGAPQSAELAKQKPVKATKAKNHQEPATGAYTVEGWSNARRNHERHRVAGSQRSGIRQRAPRSQDGSCG